MKKNSFLLLFAFLLLGVMACTNQKSMVDIKQGNGSTIKKDVRESVWDQLKKSEKENIKGSWSDATVRKITLESFMGTIEDTSFIGKEVYLIDFQLKRSGVPNNMVVYADMERGKIIGYGAVD